MIVKPPNVYGTVTYLEMHQRWTADVTSGTSGLPNEEKLDEDCSRSYNDRIEHQTMYK